MFLSCLLPVNIVHPLLQLIMHDEEDNALLVPHIMVQVGKLTE